MNCNYNFKLIIVIVIVIVSFFVSCKNTCEYYSIKSFAPLFCDHFESNKHIKVFGSSTFKQSSPIYCIALCKSGRLIASGSSDNYIRLWDSNTGNVINKFIAHDDAVTSLYYDESQSVLCSGSLDKSIKLWNINNYNNLLCINTEKPIKRIALTKDNKYLVSLSPNENKLSLWNADTGALYKNVNFPCEIINTFVTTNNNTIILCGTFGYISEYDYICDKIIKIFKGHNGRIESVCYDYVRSVLASGGGDGSIVLWNYNDAKETKRICLNGDLIINNLEFTSNGQNIICCNVGDVSEIQSLKLSDNSIEWSKTINHSINDVSFCTPIGILALDYNDRQICIFKMDHGECLTNMYGHNGPITSISFSQDYDYLVTSSAYDGTVRVWNTNTKIQLHEFDGYRNAKSISYNKLLLLSDDGHLHYTRLDKAELKISKYECSGTLLSKGGNNVFACEYNGKIFVNDFDNGIIRSFIIDNIGASSIAISSDNKMIALGGFDENIVLWNILKGERIKTFVLHQNDVNSLEFSPDNAFLASGSGDGNVRIWDIMNGSGLCKTIINNNDVWAVAYSHDGYMLASGDADGIIHIIEAANGKELFKFNTNCGDVKAIAFSHNGTRLTSGNSNATATMFDLFCENGICGDVSELMWDKLAIDDSREAWKTITQIVNSRDMYIKYIYNKLNQMNLGAREIIEINRLIKILDSEDVAIRENATLELEHYGLKAERRLRDELINMKSPEVISRVKMLLDKMCQSYPHCTGEYLRLCRIVFILERINTKSSLDLLEYISSECPCLNIRKAARDSICRLNGKVEMRNR